MPFALAKRHAIQTERSAREIAAYEQELARLSETAKGLEKEAVDAGVAAMTGQEDKGKMEALSTPREDVLPSAVKNEPVPSQEDSAPEPEAEEERLSEKSLEEIDEDIFDDEAYASSLEGIAAPEKVSVSRGNDDSLVSADVWDVQLEAVAARQRTSDHASGNGDLSVPEDAFVERIYGNDEDQGSAVVAMVNESRDDDEASEHREIDASTVADESTAMVVDLENTPAEVSEEGVCGKGRTGDRLADEGYELIEAAIAVATTQANDTESAEVYPGEAAAALDGRDSHRQTKSKRHRFTGEEEEKAIELENLGYSEFENAEPAVVETLEHEGTDDADHVATPSRATSGIDHEICRDASIEASEDGYGSESFERVEAGDGGSDDGDAAQASVRASRDKVEDKSGQTGGHLTAEGGNGFKSAVLDDDGLSSASEVASEMASRGEDNALDNEMEDEAFTPAKSHLDERDLADDVLPPVDDDNGESGDAAKPPMVDDKRTMDDDDVGRSAAETDDDMLPWQTLLFDASPSSVNDETSANVDAAASIAAVATALESPWALDSVGDYDRDDTAEGEELVSNSGGVGGGLLQKFASAGDGWADGRMEQEGNDHGERAALEQRISMAAATVGSDSDGGLLLSSPGDISADRDHREAVPFSFEDADYEEDVDIPSSTAHAEGTRDDVDGDSLPAIEALAGGISSSSGDGIDSGSLSPSAPSGVNLEGGPELNKVKGVQPLLDRGYDIVEVAEAGDGYGASDEVKFIPSVAPKEGEAEAAGGFAGESLFKRETPDMDAKTVESARSIDDENYTREPSHDKELSQENESDDRKESVSRMRDGDEDNEEALSGEGKGDEDAGHTLASGWDADDYDVEEEAVARTGVAASSPVVEEDGRSERDHEDGLGGDAQAYDALPPSPSLSSGYSDVKGESSGRDEKEEESGFTDASPEVMRLVDNKRQQDSDIDPFASPREGGCDTSVEGFDYVEGAEMLPKIPAAGSGSKAEEEHAPTEQSKPTVVDPCDDSGSFDGSPRPQSGNDSEEQTPEAMNKEGQSDLERSNENGQSFGYTYIEDAEVIQKPATQANGAVGSPSLPDKSPRDAGDAETRDQVGINDVFSPQNFSHVESAELVEEAEQGAVLARVEQSMDDWDKSKNIAGDDAVEVERSGSDESGVEAVEGVGDVDLAASTAFESPAYPSANPDEEGSKVQGTRVPLGRRGSRGADGGIHGLKPSTSIESIDPDKRVVTNNIAAPKEPLTAAAAAAANGVADSTEQSPELQDATPHYEAVAEDGPAVEEESSAAADPELLPGVSKRVAKKEAMVDSITDHLFASLLKGALHEGAPARASDGAHTAFDNARVRSGDAESIDNAGQCASVGALCGVVTTASASGVDPIRPSVSQSGYDRPRVDEVVAAASVDEDVLSPPAAAQQSDIIPTPSVFGASPGDGRKTPATGDGERELERLALEQDARDAEEELQKAQEEKERREPNDWGSATMTETYRSEEGLSMVIDDGDELLGGGGSSSGVVGGGGGNSGGNGGTNSSALESGVPREDGGQQPGEEDEVCESRSLSRGSGGDKAANKQEIFLFTSGFASNRSYIVRLETILRSQIYERRWIISTGQVSYAFRYCCMFWGTPQCAM